MTKQGKKIVAPIIITLCISAYYAIIGAVLYKTKIPLPFKIAAVVFSLTITILLIMVLIERIKEIKQGEEDDLGKY